jgi:hypothetical protein
MAPPPTPVSSHPKAPADFPRRIAVLPVANDAGNPDGAIILRGLAVQTLERDLGYIVQKPDDTDQTIHDRTLTGPEIPIQVALARQDPNVLTSWLGVDGLLHGELLAFNRAQLTLYVRSQVKVHFWLTDKNGKKIWEATKDSDNGNLSVGGGGSAALDSALQASNIPPDVANRIRNSPLGADTLAVVEAAFSTFPIP